MHQLRSMLLGVVVMMVAGCATVPAVRTAFRPVSELPAGKGLIYLYRPEYAYGRNAVFRVDVNGVAAAQLVDGSYAPLVVEAGTVRLAPYAGRVAGPPLVVEVAVGQTQYVRVLPDYGILRMFPVLHLVHEEIASVQIVPTRLASQ